MIKMHQQAFYGWVILDKQEIPVTFFCLVILPLNLLFNEIKFIWQSVPQFLLITHNSFYICIFTENQVNENWGGVCKNSMTTPILMYKLFPLWLLIIVFLKKLFSQINKPITRLTDQIWQIIFLPAARNSKLIPKKTKIFVWCTMCLTLII